MGKIARKFMASYVDSSTTVNPSYARLGADLEEFNVDMGANVNKSKNILGETTTSIDGYEPNANVEPYYAIVGDPLFARLQAIIDGRLTLDDLNTTVVEVHLWEETGQQGVYVAYRENAVIEVVSYGGDTTGYQIPFNLHLTGSRVKGKFNVVTKIFTADTGMLAPLSIEVKTGGTSTTTKVTDVIGEAVTSNLLYKTAASLTVPNYGDSASGYSALTIGSALNVTAGHKIIVVEATSASGGTIIAASPVTNVVTG